MNLEVCKRCLPNGLIVEIYCDEEDHNEGDTEIWVFYAFLYTKSEKFTYPHCRIDCGFAIDIRFLGEKRHKGPYKKESFYIKTDLLEEFFSMLESSCVHRITDDIHGCPTNCFCSLDHDVYDWNVKE